MVAISSSGPPIWMAVLIRWVPPEASGTHRSRGIESRWACEAVGSTRSTIIVSERSPAGRPAVTGSSGSRRAALSMPTSRMFCGSALVVPPVSTVPSSTRARRLYLLYA